MLHQSVSPLGSSHGFPLPICHVRSPGASTTGSRNREYRCPLLGRYLGTFDHDKIRFLFFLVLSGITCTARCDYLCKLVNGRGEGTNLACAYPL